MSSSKQYAPKTAPQITEHAAQESDLLFMPVGELAPHHRSDLRKSGLSDATIEAEHIISAPSFLVKERTGCDYGPALMFQFGGGFDRFKVDRLGEYRQKAGTINRLYIPKILPQHVLNDPSIPLYITEGEKKAIAACQAGIWTVSVTGVDAGFHNSELIPDFDKIAWEGRLALIVFDCDPGERSKGRVARARQKLTLVLQQRGAKPGMVLLLDDGKTKIGLDDYLIAHGAKKFLLLERQETPLWQRKPAVGEGWEETHVNISPGRVLTWNPPVISANQPLESHNGDALLPHEDWSLSPGGQREIAEYLGGLGRFVDEARVFEREISSRHACPFHREERGRRSADTRLSLETGAVKVCCHHRGRHAEEGMNSRVVGLIDWYAWKTTGKFHNLSPAELKVWVCRLAMEMGKIPTPDVSYRELPEELPADAPRDIRRVYLAIVERFRVWKAIGGYVPLSREFVSRLAGVSIEQAKDCLGWLLKHFYLRGSVYLRPDGTVGRTRDSERWPECYTLSLVDAPWKPKNRSSTFVRRTRAEWAQYYADKREQEALEELAHAEYEAAVARGDFQAYWCPDEDQGGVDDVDYLDEEPESWEGPEDPDDLDSLDDLEDPEVFGEEVSYE